MTTTTSSASLRFDVRSRLATLRGVAIVILGVALAAGFVANAAHAPAAATVSAAETVTASPAATPGHAS